MGQGLRQLWNLEAPRAAPASTASTRAFHEEFGRAMDDIQLDLRESANTGPAAAHQRLDAQRQALIAAYQRIVDELGTADEGSCAPSMKRLTESARTIRRKSASLARDARMGSEEWRARAAELDALEQKIDALEQAAVPAAADWQRDADAVRRHAEARRHREALEALDRLGPTLASAWREHRGEGADAELPKRPDLDDLSDELVVARNFITLWERTLEDVGEQIEALRSSLQRNPSQRVLCVFDGLATVMQTFPDLDLSALVRAAEGNDRKAYVETLKQTSREVRQVRQLLAGSPLLRAIDANPCFQTTVHATVNRALDTIARVLRVP